MENRTLAAVSTTFCKSIRTFNYLVFYMLPFGYESQLVSLIIFTSQIEQRCKSHDFNYNATLQNDNQHHRMPGLIYTSVPLFTVFTLCWESFCRVSLCGMSLRHRWWLG